ncbi:MAG: hypothetical protein GDA43_23645 [Hormoscilla sp. SP5CHS1]|nr:hypothetical protein [Hormoscilla sp. SP12CHS1]MBC6455806.1 hypothetical protein [Hormoscilla sp. SP5CHS1]
MDVKGWEIYVTSPVDINEAIENATASPDSDKQLEATVARYVQQEGFTVIKFNTLFYSINPNTGGQNYIGEIDIEVAEAIIEVTNQPRKKAGQIGKLITNPNMNPTGKQVILYAPNFIVGAGEAVIRVGGVMVRTQLELNRELHQIRSN